MTDRVKQVEAFFSAAPELRDHFTAAAQRNPLHAGMLLRLADDLDALSKLPVTREDRTPGQQQESMVIRKDIAGLLDYLSARTKTLAPEIDAIQTIVAKHLKP